MPTHAAVDRLLLLASGSDASIQGPEAVNVAADCIRTAEEHPDLDADELARRCVAANPDADASWICHLARVIVEQL